MAEMFKAKVRKVGTSFGVLIPMEIITKERIKEGEEVQLSLLKERKLEAIRKLFGSMKGAKPFERDREDRLDREEYQ
ncbi:AbrB/MazE/SpoVT family DNA-binding domain-containing protein [Candidatus Woesearchaeota archaeon]|nr:AbrB/MazE/SpoVT family DNA-binding domain-containing protein [Candidatus Woesearchaeota archaeon]